MHTDTDRQTDNTKTLPACIRGRWTFFPMKDWQCISSDRYPNDRIVGTINSLCIQERGFLWGFLMIRIHVSEKTSHNSETILFVDFTVQSPFTLCNIWTSNQIRYHCFNVYLYTVEFCNWIFWWHSRNFQSNGNHIKKSFTASFG